MVSRLTSVMESVGTGMERRRVSRIGSNSDAEHRCSGVLGPVAGPILRQPDLYPVQERFDDRQASYSYRNAARGTPSLSI